MLEELVLNNMKDIFKITVKLLVYALIVYLLACDCSYTFKLENHQYIAIKRGLIFGIVEDPDCPYCLSKFD